MSNTPLPKKQINMPISSPSFNIADAKDISPADVTPGYVRFRDNLASSLTKSTTLYTISVTPDGHFLVTDVADSDHRLLIHRYDIYTFYYKPYSESMISFVQAITNSTKQVDKSIMSWLSGGHKNH